MPFKNFRLRNLIPIYFLHHKDRSFRYKYKEKAENKKIKKIF